MKRFKTNLHLLSRKAPLLALVSMMNTIICSTIALAVMLELTQAYPTSKWPLVIGILIALVVWAWIAYNHKIVNYINTDKEEKHE